MSNRNYALIGGLRGVAQTISYEICLSIFLISLFVMVYSTSITWIYSITISLILRNALIVLIILFISFLAERNRTPFDFSEGESELVSGFNVEYGAGGFAVIFMAEYAIILALRLFLSIIICSNHAWEIIRVTTVSISFV